MKINFRNAIMSIFGGIKQFVSAAWCEIGGYTSTFSSFGTNIYANDTVRACIRTLAEHSSKANVKVIRRIDAQHIVPGDAKLQKMIQYRPNLYMNGKDFLAKTRTLLEIHNVVFIYIMRDDTGKCVGLYPMPQATYEALEVMGRLYIKFMFGNGSTMTHSWDDLAVLRKDYNTSDIFGDTNDALLTGLNLLNTTSEGMSNAIKSTANLRGILKSTKAMLSAADVKRQKDDFVKDYMNMTNASGIASLDATQSFEAINITPALASYKSVEELRLNIYRYFGMNEEIVMSRANADQREAFYEVRIEPFLLALSLELSYKIFTDRAQGLGNEVMFEANRMSYMSMTEKLNLMQMVDRGALTPNEWREALNLAPVDGGDMPIRRLDTAPATQTAASQPDIKGASALTTGDVTDVIDQAEEVTGKALNGAQTQSLIAVVTQYAEGKLTIGQAVNIIAMAIGVSKADAQNLLEGAV